MQYLNYVTCIMFREMLRLLPDTMVHTSKSLEKQEVDIPDTDTVHVCLWKLERDFTTELLAIVVVVALNTKIFCMKKNYC